MEKGSTLDVIEDHHSMNILLLLSDGKARVRSVVYAESSSSITASQKRINQMIKAELIAETEERLPPMRKWLVLTPKGMKVAKLIKEIEKVLTEE